VCQRTGTVPGIAVRIARRSADELMDETRFDGLTRLIGSGRTRRGLLGTAMVTTVAGISAVAPGLSWDAAAKKKRKKKKRCKPKAAGAPCTSDKQCCTKKTKRICDVPQNASNSDTVCCGGQGATCGGVDEEGNALAPFCCVGEAGVNEFVCSQNNPENPNVSGTCIPAPVK
jgi:hypothetical protein